MPNSSTQLLDLEQFFSIAKQNKTEHNILRLKSQALTNMLPEQCTCFVNTLKQNTTLTFLSLSNAPLPEVFIPTLLTALAVNTSIIDLEYNPEGLSQETIKQIKKIIRRNREEVLKQEIKTQSVVILEEDNESVLFVRAQKAAEQGDLNTLAALLPKISNWPQDVNIGAQSLLHTAAQYGQVACLRYLLSKGAEVNYNPQLNGTFTGTALFAAVGHNHYLITYLLLQAGASTQEMGNGFPILHRVRTLELARLLVKFKANTLTLCDIDKNTVLHSQLQFQNPSLNLLRFFLRRDLNINALNEQKETPLFALGLNPNLKPEVFLKIFNFLIRNGANLEIKNQDGETVREATQNEKNAWYFDMAEKEMKTLKHSALTLKTVCKRISNPLFQFFPPEMCVRIIDATKEYKVLDESNRSSLIMKQLN
ncbi:MAG TPA: ankyrin repeat domain-containing protein [Legionella sp.]|nr:ankyrin repeat domain-containing protein [Legionella sp.]